MEEGQEGCCGARPSTHGETEYSVKVGAVARAHFNGSFFWGGDFQDVCTVYLDGPTLMLSILTLNLTLTPNPNP